MITVIEVTTPGGPDVLHLAHRPDPVAEPDEIVVRVRAANINPTDLGAREGHVVGEPPQTPYVLGWDYAGDVLSVGSAVHNFTVGDRVVGMIPWYVIQGTRGAYAEAVAVKAEWTVPLPDALDYTDACTVPLNALTAQQALALLHLEPGPPLLITGASGAVGSFALQLAVQAGHHVTAVAGRDDDDWVRSLGAQTVLPRDTDYSTIGRFPKILDAVPLGEPVFPAASDGATLVTTRPVPQADRTRSLNQKVVLIQADRPALQALITQTAQGTLKTRVAQTFPLTQAADAHRTYEAGHTHGKIILLP